MEQNNDKKALKSGAWYIVSNFAVKGAVFLTTPIFTRLMTKADVGSFSNISAWVHILMIVTSLELMSAVTFAKFEYKDKLDKFISSVLVLSTITAAAFYILALVFRDAVMNLLKVDFRTLNIIFLYCIFSPALQMIQVKNRVRFEYKSSTILSLSSVLISTLTSLGLVLLFQDKLFGRVLGFYGSLIIFNAFIYVYLICKGRSVSPQYWKFALAISVPMVIHGLSGQVLSLSDRIMITSIRGEEENAMYSVAYTASTVINVLWMSLNMAWSPWAYEQMNNHTIDKLKKASRPYIAMFFAIVVMFLFVSPEMLRLMGGKKYTDAIDVMPPVVVGMFFQFVYSIYVNIEFFHKKQKYTAVGTSIAAVLNIVLNALLIPRFGYIAAAYTTLIGYIALFCIHFGIVIRMKKSSWYDTKFNISVLAVSLLLIPCLTLLYKANWVRWGLIGVCVILGLLFILKKRVALMEAIRSRSIGKIMEALKVSRTGEET